MIYGGVVVARRLSSPLLMHEGVGSKPGKYQCDFFRVICTFYDYLDTTDIR